MYQRDYILRMIEMIGTLISGILGLIRKGKLEQASEELSRIYYDMLKQDASFFRSIPTEELTDRLLKDHNYTNGHLEILAELFNAEAELDTARGDKLKAIEFSEKSLILFEFVDKSDKTLYPSRIEKMDAIRKRIEKLRAP